MYDKRKEIYKDIGRPFYDVMKAVISVIEKDEYKQLVIQDVTALKEIDDEEPMPDLARWAFGTSMLTEHLGHLSCPWASKTVEIFNDVVDYKEYL